MSDALRTVKLRMLRMSKMLRLLVGLPLLLSAGLARAQEEQAQPDCSGGWQSHIGVLSLMQYGDGLSFSYSAVFGPTAHICDGAGVAGLVAMGRWEYTDGDGTVAFICDDDGVRMEVVSGIAGFCGAGWSGDEIGRDGFKPATECTVTAERSHFYVVETGAPAQRRAYVIRGDRLEVLPVRHELQGDWVLARFTGPRISTIGLFSGNDVECPSQ